jgi:hypothetical protein
MAPFYVPYPLNSNVILSLSLPTRRAPLRSHVTLSLSLDYFRRALKLHFPCLFFPDSNMLTLRARLLCSILATCSLVPLLSCSLRAPPPPLDLGPAWHPPIIFACNYAQAHKYMPNSHAGKGRRERGLRVIH